MIVHKSSIPVSSDNIVEKYELPCPVCKCSPLLIITETDRGNEAYFSECVDFCKHPDPPTGEDVYYIHIKEHI